MSNDCAVKYSACLWQSAVHVPHPMHRKVCTVLTHPGSILIACVGQAGIQAPQPIHFSGLICPFRHFSSVIIVSKYGHGCGRFHIRVQSTQRTFLFSAPGVVTITFSGVITSAPLAVAAPLNIFSTMALKVSTTLPEVTCTAVPLI